MGRAEWEDEAAGLRVVRRDDGRPVVEVADGRDHTGQQRWREAHLSKQREGLPVYEGWQEIKRALGVSEDTAVSYAQRAVDPLPVRRRVGGKRGRPWVYQAVLRAWVESQAAKQERLCSCAPAPRGRRAL